MDTLAWCFVLPFVEVCDAGTHNRSVPEHGGICFMSSVSSQRCLHRSGNEVFLAAVPVVGSRFFGVGQVVLNCVVCYVSCKERGSFFFFFFFRRTVAGLGTTGLGYGSIRCMCIIGIGVCIFGTRNQFLAGHKISELSSPTNRPTNQPTVNTRSYRTDGTARLKSGGR